MLTAQQQVFLQALEELDLAQVQRLLADGLDPNFIDAEKGPAVSVWSDQLFKWWEKICDAHESGELLTEEEKKQDLQVHMDILEALIAAKANFHLWDAEECMVHFGMQQVQHVFLLCNVYWIIKLTQI